jgi:hypothetical protein
MGCLSSQAVRCPPFSIVFFASSRAGYRLDAINITMPADVLDQIDKNAVREGFTRSGFLAQAAKKAMAA